VNAAVCDASILFKLIVVEPDSAAASTLVRTLRAFVPEFVFLEVGNALWSRVRRGELAIEESTQLIDRLRGMDFQVQPVAPFVARALTVAAEINHPIYDCLYLALAESLDLPLVTADRRFLDALRRMDFLAVDVRTLAEFA
jgi:predicted nucleic acid-binding protein